MEPSPIKIAMRHPATSRQPRILIVRVGAMGDVIHGLPAVAGLREALPGCFIGWAIEPRWAPLLQGESGTMPLVDQLHHVNTKSWTRRTSLVAIALQILTLWRDLRAARYDICVDLQGSIRSSAIARMAGARRVVGMDAPRERPARLLYSERLKLGEKNVIGQACELVSAGVDMGISPYAVSFPVDESAEEWCNQLLSRPADDAAKPGFVLLAPTAGWGAKEWGSDRYAALARALRTTGYRVLVNVTPGARSRVAELSGAQAVPSTLAQMIALTRRAALLIGGDTGPVHLAAALGRPVVALFGPTDPERNGPNFVGARVTVLRDPASITSHKRSNETETGLQRIRVEEVLAAALAMLEGNK